MGRLLLVAIVAHVPHNLCFGHDIWAFWEATDVMFSLLFGLIGLAIWKTERIAVWQKVLGVAACCVLSYSADWNYIAVLWIVGIGIFHGDRMKQLVAFAAVAGICLLQPFLYETTIPYISYFGVFLVIPLLMQYRGERGRKSNLIKWGFYWFYPAHLLVLYLISLFV